MVSIQMKPKANSLKHVAVTANMLEWYDFSISSFLAITLGRLFFAGDDDFTAIVKSFSVFAVSYLMRPLGSMFFGYLGNRRGTGFALQWATLLMAIPTILIGLLPTYRDIGYTATALMVAFKLIQGFAAGGELPLSAYYVASRSTCQKQGIMTSLVHAGGAFGVLLASLIAFLLGNLFSRSQIEGWAWRIPFLLGLPVLLIILNIRKGMIAGDVPLRVNRKKIERFSTTRMKVFVQGALLVAAMEVGFYTLLVWLPNYAEMFLGYSRSDARLSDTLALVCYIAAILTGGFFTKYIGHKEILLSSLCSITVLSYPLFVVLLQFHAFSLLLSVQCLFALLYGSIGGVIMVVLYKLFEDNSKSFGFAITFTLPTALFGGTAPLVCSYFVRESHWLSFPAFYVALFCVLALPAAFRLSDSAHDSSARNAAAA